MVSGDQFISDKDVKERISSLFHPMCVEMEGAGIAQAAYLNKVSYVIIRAISDKADNSATMDYPTFEGITADDLGISEKAYNLKYHRMCPELT